MGKSAKMLLVILVLILIPVVLLSVNKIKAEWLEKTYPDLGQSIESRHFVMEELMFKGETLDYLGEESYGTANGGYICFDTLKKQFIIETSQYVSTVSIDEALPDELKHVCYFTYDGKPAGHMSRRYDVGIKWREHSILLSDCLTGFPSWKGDSAEIYLRHFGIRRLETRWLNPFHGMGNPNGSGLAPAWSGTGYFDLHVEGETLRFKTSVKKDGLIFSDTHDYYPDLSYCKFPDSCKIPVPAFLVYRPRFGKARIFIIKPKP